MSRKPQPQRFHSQVETCETRVYRYSRGEEFETKNRLVFFIRIGSVGKHSFFAHVEQLVDSQFGCRGVPQKFEVPANYVVSFPSAFSRAVRHDSSQMPADILNVKFHRNEVRGISQRRILPILLIRTILCKFLAFYVYDIQSTC